MPKFHDLVGYVTTVEDPPDSGMWISKPIERPYTGDILRNTASHQGDNINPNIDVSTRISVVADSYAYQNFSLIRYVRWMGAVWNVTSVDAATPPRLTMSLGGVYNGPTPD